MKIKTQSWIKRWGAGLLLLAVGVVVSGCKTLSFYAQAVRGQYQIFAHERSIHKLIADPHTDQRLKSRFELLEELRGFAAGDLKLPVDGHYLKYVDLHRPFVVWNVQAAPEFSMQPKTWWYPLLGSLEYRGYFSKPAATNYSAYLRHKGYDVAIGGVEAYSTLGWFKDPVLNTFLFEPDPELAETIFHELGHQRVFARGDTDFNEAFATTVGQEGTRRWLRLKRDPAELRSYLAHLQRNREWVRLVMNTRLRLEILYGDERSNGGKVKATDKKRNVPREQLREAKRRVLEEMKQQFEALKRQWGGDTELDEWFACPVNNAHLNSVAAYYDLVPGFEQLLARNGGNLEAFYDAVERLSKNPKKERHRWLRTLATDPMHSLSIEN